jgi:hypothetical protein
LLKDSVPKKSSSQNHTASTHSDQANKKSMLAQSEEKASDSEVAAALSDNVTEKE